MIEIGIIALRLEEALSGLGWFVSPGMAFAAGDRPRLLALGHRQAASHVDDAGDINAEGAEHGAAPAHCALAVDNLVEFVNGPLVDLLLLLEGIPAPSLPCRRASSAVSFSGMIQ